MADTSLYINTDSELKEKAQVVFSTMGMDISTAVNIFLKQAVSHNGRSFEMRMPTRKPVCMGALTEDELNAEIQKGFDDFEAGRVTSAEQVWEEMDAMMAYDMEN